jgi:hypothetical protein
MTTDSDQGLSTNINHSGGADLNAGRDTTIGGDVTGRDKTVGGDKVKGDKIIVNVAPGSTIVFGENSKQSPVSDDELSRLLSQAHDLLQQRRFDEAVGLLREAYQSDPRDQHIKKAYVDILYESGVHWYLYHELSKAKFAFQKVVKIIPTYQKAADYLRDVERRLMVEQVIPWAKESERTISDSRSDVPLFITFLILLLGMLILLSAIIPSPTLTPTSTPSPTPTTPCRVGFRCTLTGVDGYKFCDDVFEIQPQPVSSISISMTKRAIPLYGYSIWEVAAYESSTSTTNLISDTVGVQVTATSIEGNTPEDNIPYLPKNATDGNMMTRWGSAWSDKPNGKDPQVLTIMFPKPVTVGRIAIKWQDAYALDYCVRVH